MATSFAAYASQYFAKPHNADDAEASQPMFFSFATDDGSRHAVHNHDLDDLDDPHLREHLDEEDLADDDHDPYLRLDDDTNDEHPGPSIPLIARSPSPSHSVDSPPGWLAHLTAAVSPQRRRSPSPDPPSSDSDQEPPHELLVSPHLPNKRSAPLPSRTTVQPLAPPPRTSNPHSLSLTDSLLPRDGRARPLDVFSLPDPRHTPRKRRKYNDSIWTAIWLGCVCACTLFCLVLLFVTTRPPDVPSRRLPYSVFLHTVPLVTILTFVSAGVAYVHIWLLRVFVKPVMIATSVFIPATLFICAVWAFVGSFMWDGDETPTWGETVGLRLFSLIPLALSVITARRLLHLPRQIHTTSSTLTLTTHLLLLNPFLLALSPAILLAMVLASLPFVTLIFRLLLIGNSSKIKYGSSTIIEWHIYSWANWSIAGAFMVWAWSWLIARGVLRMTTASVIGAWYFSDPALPPPPPQSTHTIHAALVRSTGPSLGSIALASLILTIIHTLSLITVLLNKLPFYLRRIPWVPLSIPVSLYVVPSIRWIVGHLENWTGTLSRYALVYVGFTGVGFWSGAKRSRGLVGGVELEGVEDEVEEFDDTGRQPQRQGVRERQMNRRARRMALGGEPPLTLLTISPLTLTFPFALTTYLFVAHTLSAPHYALGAALSAGCITAMVGLFCVGLVRDTADALYLCYCIDKSAGERRREEVFIAFEYSGDPTTLPVTNPSLGLAGRRARGPPPGAAHQGPNQTQHPDVLFDATAGLGDAGRGRMDDDESSGDDERDRLIAMGLSPVHVKGKDNAKDKRNRESTGAGSAPIRNVPLSPSGYLLGTSPPLAQSKPQVQRIPNPLPPPRTGPYVIDDEDEDYEDEEDKRSRTPPQGPFLDAYGRERDPSSGPESVEDDDSAHGHGQGKRRHVTAGPQTQGATKNKAHQDIDEEDLDPFMADEHDDVGRMHAPMTMPIPMATGPSSTRPAATSVAGAPASISPPSTVTGPISTNANVGMGPFTFHSTSPPGASRPVGHGRGGVGAVGIVTAAHRRMGSNGSAAGGASAGGVFAMGMGMGVSPPTGRGLQGLVPRSPPVASQANAPSGPGEERMKTSAELNMKSRFLMDMNGSGSEDGDGDEDVRVEADEVGDGSEMFGPGSGIFKS